MSSRIKILKIIGVENDIVAELTLTRDDFVGSPISSSRLVDAHTGRDVIMISSPVMLVSTLNKDLQMETHLVRWTLGGSNTAVMSIPCDSVLTITEPSDEMLNGYFNYTSKDTLEQRPEKDLNVLTYTDFPEDIEH